MATQVSIFQKPFTVTQGGADTAAETTLATNIQPGITYGGWALNAVEFTIKPDLLKAWTGADCDFTLQFTKRSLAASISRIITYADTDLILSMNMSGIATGTAANFLIQQSTFFYTFPPGLIVYSDSVYVQCISTGTGATNVVWGRILYDLITLTQAQAFAVVASRP
jgi:hypothetical protein